MPKLRIEFEAVYGNIRKTVLISELSGSEQIYQLIIDSYYQGTITKVSSQWIGNLNAKSDLTQDDIDALGEIIENYQS